MAHTQSTDAIHPPTVAADDAIHQVQSAVTGAAAANFDWGAAIAAAGWNGKVWITVEALTTPAYVRFKATTAAAATTTSTGMLIPAGGTRRFLVDTIKHKVIDHISSGAGEIKVQVDSYGAWDRRHQ